VAVQHRVVRLHDGRRHLERRKRKVQFQTSPSKAAREFIGI
jgi:hypothetical protein